MTQLWPPLKQPYLHCVFCEDIRQEQSAQRTLVGAFSGGLQVASMPATLPRFAIFADLVLPIEFEAKSLSLRMMLDDDVIFDAEQAVNEIAKARVDMLAKGSSQRGYGIQYAMVMNNFHVARAGCLRLVAYVNDEPLVGPGFVIEQNESLLGKANPVVAQ